MKIIISIALLVLSIGLFAQVDKLKGRVTERLNLTAEQAEQFEAIMQERKAIAQQAKENADAQLASVLSEEQYADWLEMQERRQMRKELRREALQNRRGEPLDLTDEQKEQLQAVLEESRSKIMAVRDETEASMATFLDEEQIAQVKRKIRFKLFRRFN